jgi:hypothetical protein
MPKGVGAARDEYKKPATHRDAEAASVSGGHEIDGLMEKESDNHAPPWAEHQERWNDEFDPCHERRCREHHYMAYLCSKREEHRRQEGFDARNEL